MDQPAPRTVVQNPPMTMTTQACKQRRSFMEGVVLRTLAIPPGSVKRQLSQGDSAGSTRHTHQIVVGQATSPAKVYRATRPVNPASGVACRTMPAESAGPL